MVPARLLVWMITVVALLLPPGMTIHAMAPAGQAASVDCPGHAPPPDPCPDHDTAKHAAGACCPLMAGAVALLPATIAGGEAASSSAFVRIHARRLSGRVVKQEPPPPRV
jgi:hypothetical protein